MRSHHYYLQNCLGLVVLDGYENREYEEAWWHLNRTLLYPQCLNVALLFHTCCLLIQRTGSLLHCHSLNILCDGCSLDVKVLPLFRIPRSASVFARLRGLRVVCVIAREVVEHHLIEFPPSISMFYTMGTPILARETTKVAHPFVEHILYSKDSPLRMLDFSTFVRISKE